MDVLPYHQEQTVSYPTVAGLGFFDSAQQAVQYVLQGLGLVASSPPVNLIAEQAAWDLANMAPEELDSNWKLTSYFGQIKVITANTKGVRFLRCVEELASVGVGAGNYTIFPAVNGASIDPQIWSRAHLWGGDDTDKQKQGRMGCYLAHYYAIKDSYDRLRQAHKKLEQLQKDKEASLDMLMQATALVKKYSSVLIIEDNAGFGTVTGANTATLAHTGTIWRRALQDLPTDWDMFYLITMADDWGPSKQVSSHLVQLNYGVVTKGYAVQACMYKPIIDALEQDLFGVNPIDPIDHALAHLQSNHKCYAIPGPSLIYRFGSKSEVLNIEQMTPSHNWQTGIYKVSSEIEN